MFLVLPVVERSANSSPQRTQRSTGEAQRARFEIAIPLQKVPTTYKNLRL
jgi:hypothetical protein